MGGVELPVPFNFGWWYFDMKISSSTAIPSLSQSWIGAVHEAQGLFSVGLEAEPLDSGCAPLTTNPGSN